MLALALTHLADRRLVIAWAMCNGLSKLLTGKGYTKGMVYDICIIMLLRIVFPIETKLFCSNDPLTRLVSGKLILYHLKIPACQEVVELSIM
jgi:hypothetical protein